MADQAGYSNFSAFQYLVAMGVMTWLWLWFLIPAYIFDLHSKYPMLNLVEFVADVFFAFMNMIAGIAAAAKCNETVFQNIKLCDNADKPKAAAVRELHS